MPRTQSPLASAAVVLLLSSALAAIACDDGGSAAEGGNGGTGPHASAPAGGMGAGGAKTSTGDTSTGALSGGTTSLGTSASAGATGTTVAIPTAAVRCDNLAAAAGAPGQAQPSQAIGGLKVLDWAGFKGAVSFTFDDATSSQISNYAKLQATGARATFFLVSSWGGATNPIWKTALTDGHELGNHTKSHSASANLTDLQSAQDFLASTFGVTAYSMAAPNGDGSWSSVAPNLLLLNRGVSDGLVAVRGNSNPHSLPAYLPPEGASAAVMDAAVSAAKNANSWKIFCVHGFSGDSAAYHPVDVAAMTATMSNAVSSGVWTETMTHVGAYWLGQKLIADTATTGATWTLPAHFPPNMCLRVTTTGGTVKQKGVVIPWNEHGYYEIALDAGEVRVE